MEAIDFEKRVNRIRTILRDSSLTQGEISKRAVVYKKEYGFTELGKLWDKRNYVTKFISGGSRGGLNISNINAAEVLAEKIQESEIDNLNLTQETIESLTKSVLAKKFFRELQLSFNKKFNSQTDKNLTEYISNRKKIHPSTVDEFITSFPTYLIGHASQFFRKNHISDLIQTSKFDSYNNLALKSKLKSVKDVCDYKGALLGHSLSPIPDNILLLMEIGQYSRMSITYNLESYIICTNEEYALNNEICSCLIESGIDEEVILAGLSKCLKYRKKLYSLLGIEEGDKLQILKVESNSPYKKMNKQEVLRDVQYFNDFANEIKKINKSLSKSEKIDDNISYILTEMLSHQEIDKEVSEKINEVCPFLRNTEKLKLPLTILSHIKNTFKNIEEYTLLYSLLQRYAQHEYNGYLKFGGSSEAKFDSLYAILDDKFHVHDPEETIDNFNLDAFYYKHYEIPVDSDTSAVIIPYYTPNKALYQKLGNELDNVYKIIPLVLDDYTKSGDGYLKLVKISNIIQLPELAKQLSDILSFSVYAFGDTDTTFWLEIEKITMPLSEEFANAIIRDKTSNGEDIMRNFGHQVLTLIGNFSDVPFYFYTYLLAMEAVENRELEIKLREYYSNCISLIMNQLQSVISYRNWKI